MDAGYEPGRIRLLSQRTCEAIDALRTLTSHDPAAAEAVRTVRLTRRNLEDHWMSALRDIETSSAMVMWRRSQLRPVGARSTGVVHHALPDHLHTPAGALSIPSSVRADLLGQLAWLERMAVAMVADEGGPTDSELDALARQLAFWVDRDDEFAAQVAELAASNMSIGFLVQRAHFPTSFVAGVVQRMAVPNGPATNIDHHRYAASWSSALADLIDDPAACLDLLLDPSTAFAIAAWGDLDADVVSDFFVSGLRSAVAGDPVRLQDGFDVLTLLTQAANGPLDSGFGPGAARGLATAMPTYLDVLAPAVVFTGRHDRFEVSNDATQVSADFGTYGDLQGMYGAIMRDETARIQLGHALATWAQEALTSADGREEFAAAVVSVSEFTTMILDAADDEQAQVVARFDAAEAAEALVVDSLAWGVDLALGAKGANPFVSEGITLLITTGYEVIDGDYRPDDVTAVGLGETVREQMLLAAVTVGLAQPAAFRTGDSPARLTPEQRRVVTSRLRDIRNATSGEHRTELVDTLIENIGDAPALLPAVNVVEHSGPANVLAGR